MVEKALLIPKPKTRSMAKANSASTRPQWRLIDISTKQRISPPLRGRNSAQISRSAFQVSAVLFLGFTAGLSDAIAGAATTTVGCVDIPSRFPGVAVMLIGCVDLNSDYTPEAGVWVRCPGTFFKDLVTTLSSR